MQNNFEKSVKPKAVEEYVDYYFYRRLAHFLVPLLIRLKISPNIVTLLSLATGLTAAKLVYHQQFVAATFVAIGAIVLDCCDGQVARLTGQSSPVGRILDGICDAIWITMFWLGIHFSQFFQEHGIKALYFMSAAGASMYIHCWRYDGVKIVFLERSGSNFSEKAIDFDSAWSQMKMFAKKGNLLNAFFYFAMAFQMYFFVKGKKTEAPKPFTPEQKKELETVMAHWTWLGEGMHNTILLIGCLLAPLSPYLLWLSIFIILVPMNLWLLWCEYSWRKKI